MESCTKYEKKNINRRKQHLVSSLIKRQCHHERSVQQFAERIDQRQVVRRTVRVDRWDDQRRSARKRSRNIWNQFFRWWVQFSKADTSGRLQIGTQQLRWLRGRLDLPTIRTDPVVHSGYHHQTSATRKENLGRFSHIRYSWQHSGGSSSQKKNIVEQIKSENKKKKQ